MTINEYREVVHSNTKYFDSTKALDAVCKWLDTYAAASNMTKAVLGISGGKDSTVVAAILAKVLGKENVIGILMPNGAQSDIADSLRVVRHTEILYTTFNIREIYDSFINIMGHGESSADIISEEAKINIAPRIRMTALYAYGQTHGYRVAGTGNLSERLLGYFTKWGDGASDFNLLANFTSLEVMRLGEELGLPLELVYKTPADGLSGKSDEEKLGVNYVDVHNYIRGKKDKISLFTRNEYKIEYDKIQRIFDRAKHKLNTDIPAPDYRYFLGELPELGKEVELTMYNNDKIKAFLTRTSFYTEDAVFEEVNTYKDIRVDNVYSWKYVE